MGSDTGGWAHTWAYPAAELAPGPVSLAVGHLGPKLLARDQKRVACGMLQLEMVAVQRLANRHRPSCKMPVAFWHGLTLYHSGSRAFTNQQHTLSRLWQHWCRIAREC